MARRKKILQILCFGDSLTSGYYDDGESNQPYSKKLTQTLSAVFPEYEIRTTVNGVPGDPVSSEDGTFLSRMNNEFAGDAKFDWTIVLGGTNDLGSFRESAEIFEDLESVYRIPLARGSKVLALTVPEADVEHPYLDELRDGLNDLIKGYKAENFHVFDLHAAIPCKALSEDERQQYWDDCVHLTAYGYNLVGEKVGEALVALLQKEDEDGMNARKSCLNFGKVFFECS